MGYMERIVFRPEDLKKLPKQEVAQDQFGDMPVFPAPTMIEDEMIQLEIDALNKEEDGADQEEA